MEDSFKEFLFLGNRIEKGSVEKIYLNAGEHFAFENFPTLFYFELAEEYAYSRYSTSGNMKVVPGTCVDKKGNIVDVSEITIVSCVRVLTTAELEWYFSLRTV